MQINAYIASAVRGVPQGVSVIMEMFFVISYLPKRAV
jgi:hypothetical protein